METRPNVGSYQLYPHRHVKIWFSRDEDIFLNPENRLRLVRLRANNPHDTLSFIYDKSLLSAKAQLNLQQFCMRHNIEALDIADLKKELVTDQEKELMGYVEEEIRHTKDDTGGNFGAASDILRWLSPVYKRGIYSDFDVEITTNNLPELIEVQAPIILNLGTLIVKQFFFTTKGIVNSNDISAVPEPRAAFSSLSEMQSEKISCIQQKILKNYRDKEMNFRKLLTAGDFDSALAGISEQSIAMLGGPTIFAIRQAILRIFSSNESFINFSLSDTMHSVPIMNNLFFRKFNCKFSEAVASGKFQHELQTFFIEQAKKSLRLLSPASDLLSQPDDEFITKTKIKLESEFYKTTVVNYSGPLVIAKALMSWASAIDYEDLRPYSWEHYGLDTNFKSGQQFKFNTSSENYFGKIATLKVGDVCDASWAPEGRAAQKKREACMDSKARLIQFWCREYLHKKHAAQEQDESKKFVARV